MQENNDLGICQENVLFYVHKLCDLLSRENNGKAYISWLTVQFS